MENLINIKIRLEEFLKLSGISYNGKLKTWRCPNHSDENESGVLYKNNDGHIFYCPVCAESWDIFQIAGIIYNENDFKNQLKIVKDRLGIIEEKNEKSNIPIPLKHEDALKIYDRKIIENISTGKPWGKIVDSWSYIDENENVLALDVRFENDKNKKFVITFWYNGELTWANTPVFIYGLNLIKKYPDKKIIIHEGAKCAKLGNEFLENFVNISWSGGSGKSGIPDWSFLKNKDVCILQDNDDPGKKAALKIKKQLTNAKILKPMTDGNGDDIEQWIEKYPLDEINNYILNKNNIESFDDAQENPRDAMSNLCENGLPLHNSTSCASSNDSTPFRILGIGDDGRAAFISEEGRLQKWNLDGLSKSKLMVLTGREYWKNNFPNGKNGIDWDNAIDETIRISQNIDFNESNIRGRGAWRDGEKISYHDGINTYGETNDKKIYLRLPKKDIGINEEKIDDEIIKNIKDEIFKMSFETKTDAIRCLGWSVLAPFAGALKFRPAILLTGSSGTGKTTVANLCIRRLAMCEWFNGSESTVAGVRGKIKYDSCGIMFEETEADTLKKRTNRDELFSLMRVNVSDDAPDTVKGTKDGGFNSFKMQNMFGFIAIDPTVESVADENRIFRINMIKPSNQNEWKKIENNLINLLNEKNCRSIRALTWKKLKEILKLSDYITDFIRKKTGKDYRSSYADAMLVSSFIKIWSRVDDPTDEQIINLLNKYYEFQQPEDTRDESEEIIDRIMDETIEVLHKNDREKITILECLQRINTEKNGDICLTDGEINDYKLCAARNGLRIIDCGNIAISNNHHIIKKIIGVSNGYSKIFRRHPGIIESQKLVHFYDGGKPKRCTVISGIIEENIKKMTEDEKLGGLF